MSPFLTVLRILLLVFLSMTSFSYLVLSLSLEMLRLLLLLFLLCACRFVGPLWVLGPLFLSLIKALVPQGAGLGSSYRTPFSRTIAFP